MARSARPRKKRNEASDHRSVLVGLLTFLTLAAGPDRLSDPVPADGGHPQRGSATVERETFLMGTRLRARVEAVSRERAIEAAEAAFDAVAEMESRLSTWRSDTELAAVNRAPVGQPVRVSERLYRLLAEVRTWSLRTGGAFDPAVGALVDAWDLRGAGAVPAPDVLREALRATGLDCFQRDPERRSVIRRCRDAWLDAGAFGKGAGLRAAAGALRDAGVEAALLDFGGQVLATGTAPAGGWRVGIAHPVQRDEPLLELRLESGSTSTTGQSERWREVDGVRRGHVLDPRDGRPVPPWGSVTVVAPDPLVADILSTALFVMGPEQGARWAAGRTEVGVIFLRQRGPEVLACVNSAARGLLEDGTGGPEVRLLRQDPDGGARPIGRSPGAVATEARTCEWS